MYILIYICFQWEFKYFSLLLHESDLRAKMDAYSADGLLSSTVFHCFPAFFAEIRALSSTAFPRNHWALSGFRRLCRVTTTRTVALSPNPVAKGTTQECSKNKGGWFLLPLTFMSLNFVQKDRKTFQVNLVVWLWRSNGQTTRWLLPSAAVDGIQIRMCFPKLYQHISSHTDEPQHDVYMPNLNIKDAPLAQWGHKNIKWQPHPDIKRGTMPCDPSLFLA